MVSQKNKLLSFVKPIDSLFVQWVRNEEAEAVIHHFHCIYISVWGINPATLCQVFLHPNV